MAINTVVQTGRLTNDPEMKYTAAGMPITTFRIAVDRGTRDADGKMMCDFFNCVAFQKRAEMIAEYFDKGAPIGIEGKLQSNDWTGQDGKKNYSVVIVVNAVSFQESKWEKERRQSAKGNGGGGVPQGRDAAVESGFGGPAIDQNDDPFGPDQ